MFWRLTGFSTASPVERILDKGIFTLEELLEEDEIIQECKALNGRLIDFLREQAQIEQLIIYLVEEAPDDSEKRRAFKYPFIACEIFTCEVDIILKTLVEDEKLMNLLFSFLNQNHCHSTQLAGYFSKVVICLMSQKTGSFLQYVQAHQDILQRLVDLIGITSIMEVLIRLLGADERLYTDYAEEMKWIEGTDMLELIVDKFSSSDLPEVHANAAEALHAVTEFSPPGLADKICSPSFIGRLFSRALDKSRPKSALVNSLSVCISLLDPKRQARRSYHMYGNHCTHGTTTVANPATVEGMLESLGDLLKLLGVSSVESVLLTTYGKLQPPLGKHRLKIVEFISVLLASGSKAAEKTMIQLGGLKKALHLFLEYPYNNFLHHHVESIILYCLESKNTNLLEHLLCDCDLVGEILKAEKNATLTSDPNSHTIATEGKPSPRIGNIGHLTQISNKLVQLGKKHSEIQAHLQNSEWSDWHRSVLLKRNRVENVYQWSCGRPTTLLDRYRYFDDYNYQDRDDDAADVTSKAHGSHEQDEKDTYYGDESAENPNEESAKDDDSPSQQGSDRKSDSLLTNSNWFAAEKDKATNKQASATNCSPSPSSGPLGVIDGNESRDLKDGNLVETAPSTLSGTRPDSTNQNHAASDTKENGSSKSDKPPEQVQSIESLNSVGTSEAADKPIVKPSESDKAPEQEIESGKSLNSVNTPEVEKPLRKSSKEHHELHGQGGGKHDLSESKTRTSSPLAKSHGATDGGLHSESSEEHQELRGQGGGKHDLSESRTSTSSPLAKSHGTTAGGLHSGDEKPSSMPPDSASINVKTAGEDDVPNPKGSKDDQNYATLKNF